MSVIIRAFLIIVAAIVFCTAAVFAQSADGRTPLLPKTGDRDNEDQPMGIREKLEKLRIEKEQKDYEETLERSQEASKLSDELEKSVTSSGKLAAGDMTKIARIEKLVKKIRDSLGGGDDDQIDDDDAPAIPKNTADAVTLLKTNTTTLYDELKKNTRFTISAAAIFSTNTVLKLARILKVKQ
jgi:ElaB/YqjD/DUF883 family membrane-anchored ribosome-binding protein